MMDIHAFTDGASSGRGKLACFAGGGCLQLSHSSRRKLVSHLTTVMDMYKVNCGGECMDDDPLGL